MISTYYNKFITLGDSRRFSPLDYATIVAAIISILTGTFFLIFDQGEITPLRDLKPIAKVGPFEKSPQRKIVGTLAWNGVATEEVLFRGDQILTDSTSRIDVFFLDDTFLKVPPNSLIKLDFNNGEFDIELIKGYLDIKLSKDNDKVTIRKGNKKYKIEGENGKVQVLSGAKNLQFKTLSGDLKIDGKNSQSLNQDSKALYQITRPLNKTVFNPLKDDDIALNLKPASIRAKGSLPPPDVVISRYPNLRNGQKIKTTKDNLKNGLNFKLPRPGLYYLGVKEPGASEYKITPFEVASYGAPQIINQNSNKVIQVVQGEKVALGWIGKKRLTYEVEVKVGDKSKVFKVTDSKKLLPIFRSTNLKYRVRVLSPNAPWSSWAKKTIKVSAGLIVDKSQTPDIFVKKAPDEQIPLVIASKSSNSAPLYFEVSTDKSFKKTILKKKTNKNFIKTIKLKPGVYYWRSKTLTRPSKSTDIHKIVIKSPAVTNLPYFKKKQASSSKAPVARFIWEEALPGTQYELVIKNQEGKPIEKKTVVGNKAKVRLPSLGKYTWMVTPKNNKEFLLPTQESPLEITLPKTLDRPQIASKQVIYYRYINGVEAYEIELPEYKFAEFYTLEVYRDPEAKRLLFKKSFPKNKGYWVSNRSGKYYYRVKITDKWGRVSGYSKMGTLIFPISPLVKDKIKIDNEGKEDNINL